MWLPIRVPTKYTIIAFTCAWGSGDDSAADKLQCACKKAWGHSQLVVSAGCLAAAGVQLTHNESSEQATLRLGTVLKGASTVTLGLAFNYTLAPTLSGFYRSTFTGESGRTLLSLESYLWMYSNLGRGFHLCWLSSWLGCPCVFCLSLPLEINISGQLPELVHLPHAL